VGSWRGVCGSCDSFSLVDFVIGPVLAAWLAACALWHAAQLVQLSCARVRVPADPFVAWRLRRGVACLVLMSGV
jgi:hypothetical protein